MFPVYICVCALSADPTIYSRAVLVNNAGSFEYVGRTNDIPSFSTLKQEIDLNVTACLWVTSRFAGLFGANGSTKPPSRTTTSGAEPQQTTEKAAAGPSSACRNVVVNVSSLAAVQPIKYWACYSAGKAARDMFHRQARVPNKQKTVEKTLVFKKFRTFRTIFMNPGGTTRPYLGAKNPRNDLWKNEIGDTSCHKTTLRQ